MVEVSDEIASLSAQMQKLTTAVSNLILARSLQGTFDMRKLPKNCLTALRLDHRVKDEAQVFDENPAPISSSNPVQTPETDSASDDYLCKTQVHEPSTEIILDPTLPETDAHMLFEDIPIPNPFLNPIPLAEINLTTISQPLIPGQLLGKIPRPNSFINEVPMMGTDFRSIHTPLGANPPVFLYDDRETNLVKPLVSTNPSQSDDSGSTNKDLQSRIDVTGKQTGFNYAEDKQKSAHLPSAHKVVDEMPLPDFIWKMAQSTKMEGNKSDESNHEQHMGCDYVKDRQMPSERHRFDRRSQRKAKVYEVSKPGNCIMMSDETNYSVEHQILGELSEPLRSTQELSALFEAGNTLMYQTRERQYGMNKVIVGNVPMPPSHCFSIRNAQVSHIPPVINQVWRTNFTIKLFEPSELYNRKFNEHTHYLNENVLSVNMVIDDEHEPSFCQQKLFSRLGTRGVILDYNSGGGHFPKLDICYDQLWVDNTTFGLSKLIMYVNSNLDTLQIPLLRATFDLLIVFDPGGYWCSLVVLSGLDDGHRLICLFTNTLMYYIKALLFTTRLSEYLDCILFITLEDKGVFKGKKEKVHVRSPYRLQYTMILWSVFIISSHTKKRVLFLKHAFDTYSLHCHCSLWKDHPHCFWLSLVVSLAWCVCQGRGDIDDIVSSFKESDSFNTVQFMNSDTCLNIAMEPTMNLYHSKADTTALKAFANFLSIVPLITGPIDGDITEDTTHLLGLLNMDRSKGLCDVVNFETPPHSSILIQAKWQSLLLKVTKVTLQWRPQLLKYSVQIYTHTILVFDPGGRYMAACSYLAVQLSATQLILEDKDHFMGWVMIHTEILVRGSLVICLLLLILQGIMPY